jgi:hypothetical protein
VLAVHEVPLYSSVALETTVVKPPKAKPAVCVPAPANCSLAVFKFPPAVQDVPSYSSVFATATVVRPPNPKATV